MCPSPNTATTKSKMRSVRLVAHSWETKKCIKNVDQKRKYGVIKWTIFRIDFLVNMIMNFQK